MSFLKWIKILKELDYFILLMNEMQFEKLFKLTQACAGFPSVQIYRK